MSSPDDVVWIDVLPSLQSFTRTLRGGLRGATATARGAGAEAGAAYGAGFGTSAASAVAKSTKAVETAQKRVADATGRLTVAQARLADVQGATKVSAGRLAAAEEAVAKAERDVMLQTANLTRAQEAQTRVQATASAAGAEAAAGAGLLTRRMGEGVAGAGLLSRAMGGVSKAMMAAFTLTLPALPITYALHQAGDFQTLLVKLTTTAGESQKNLGLVGSGILKMAGQVGIGADDLAKAMYTIDSAGFHGAQSLNILEASAQGAQQEQADLGKVVNAVTTIMHDYGPAAGDAANVTSKLVAAVSTGKVTFEELTGAMYSITPLAAALHIPLSDIVGSLAAMTASGETAEQSAENMRNALQHLAVPTKPMIDELAQLGITATDLSDDLSTKGLAGTLQVVSNAILNRMGPSGKILLDTLNKSKIAFSDMNQMIGTMPPDLAKLSKGLLNGSVSWDQYRKAIRSMGGQAAAEGKQFLSLHDTADGFNQLLKTGKPNVQNYEQALQLATGTTAGLTVALQLTGAHADVVNENIKKIAGSSKQADGNIRGWAEVQGNFNQKLAEARASLQTMAIQIGQKLLPAAGSFASWIAHTAVPALQNFGHWISAAFNSAPVQAMIDFLHRHVTAVHAVSTALLTLLGVYKALKLAQTVYMGISAGLASIAGQLSPVRLVIAGIAALAAGLDYAYHHSETFRSAIHNLAVGFQRGSVALYGSGLDIFMQRVGVAARDAFDFLKHLWQEISGPVIRVFGEAAGAVGGFLHSLSPVVDALSGLGSALKNLGLAVFRQLRDVLGQIGQALSNAAPALGNMVSSLLPALGAIIGALVTAFTHLLTWVSQAASVLITFATHVLPVVMVPIKLLATALGGVATVLSHLPGPVLAVAAALAILKIAFGLSIAEAFATVILNIRVAFALLATSAASGAGAFRAAMGSMVAAARGAAAGVSTAMAEMRVALVEGQAAAWASGAGVVRTQMAGMVGAARAGFGAIGSAAKGLAVGGLAVLGRGLKGLMAMLGGPWGVAIITAVAAIWGFNQLIKQHDEEVKKATRDVKGWYLAIAKGGPGADQAIRNVTNKQLELFQAQAKLNDLQSQQGVIYKQAGRGAGAYNAVITEQKQKVHDLATELENGWRQLTPLQKLQVKLNTAIREYGQNSPQAAAAARALNDAQNAQATADSKAKYALEGLNGELHKNIDLQLAAVDQQLGAQSAVLSAQSAIESYKSALKDSNATDVEKAQAQNSMAQAITQAVEQTEAAVVANEKSVDPQKRAADATAAARTVFDQLTKSVGGVPPELQGLANTLDGATTSSLGDTSTQLNITSGDVGNLGKSFSTMTKNDVLQVTVPGLSKMSDTLNGPTVSALTNGQSMSAKLGQAFINVKDKITTVFIPGLGTMQGNLNGPTVNALLTTIAKTGNATDAIGYLASAVKNLPKGTVIDIGADTSAAKNSLDTLITSYGKVTYTGSSIIVNGRVIANAEGNLLSRATPMRGDVATVVPKDTPRLIGDNMTSAEAFIPINGSPRSHKILSATAGQMGYGLVPMASGGIAEPIRWPAWRPPHETFPVRWQPGFLDTIAKDMVALQNAAKATAAAGGAVGSADVMQALSAAASAYGWSTGVQWQDLLAVIRRESGFNPRAQNPTSSAAGLGQFITSTWDAYRPAAASGYPTMKSAPVMYQAQAIMRYIRQVYGTPAGAEHSEQTRGWYDNGGLWPSGTTGVNTTGDIERVLAPPQDDYFRRFVDAAESMLHGKNQPTQLVGDLYLDSGEFLGKVRGVATAVLDARDATDARNLRSARL